MGIRIEYTDNAQAMLKHMILLTILSAACAVDNRANGQKLIDDLLAADVEGLASETCASYAPPSASATYDTPLKPPTNTKGLIPQGVGVLYANLTANPLPTSVDCGKPCFAADCYTKVPDECCAGAESVFTDLSTTFVDGLSCAGPTTIAPGIDVYVAGGCTDDGEMYYGEQCGGSTFGPFSQLTNADGTAGAAIGYGVCAQPAAKCNCNAVVKTKKAGCYNIGTPPCAPGSDCSRYFLKVPKTVCKAPTTPAPKDVDCKKVSSDKRSRKRRKACKATDGCMWTTHKGCVATSK